MKNIGSNIVDFLNKLKIGKMMKIVLNNKFILLCLVLLVLFYHLYYSKSFKEGIEDIISSTDTVEEEENNITPATDSTTRKSKGAYDRSVNIKIKSTEDEIKDKKNKALGLKEDINDAIELIQTNLEQIISRDNAIADKIPKNV